MNHIETRWDTLLEGPAMQGQQQKGFSMSDTDSMDELEQKILAALDQHGINKVVAKAKAIQQLRKLQ